MYGHHVFWFRFLTLDPFLVNDSSTSQGLKPVEIHVFEARKPKRDSTAGNTENTERKVGSGCDMAPNVGPYLANNETARGVDHDQLVDT